MNRTMATISLLTVLSGCLWAQTSTQPQSQAPVAKHTAKKKKAAPKKEAPQPPAVTTPAPPPRPEPPPTLANSAPVKPNVTMQSGLLTIDAPNSTLSDVLNGVHKATGASIEGASPIERVAVKLGPGKPEQVIAALLRGTPYDYVILGAPGRADAVTRIVLTPASAQSPQAQTQARRPEPQSEEQPEPDEAPPAQQQQPPVADTEPGQQPPNAPSAPEEQQQQQPQAQQQQQQQPPARSVDEFFRELQLMNHPNQPQQQQQQQPPQ
jgi:outer membrane biosynthesis protein TonB